MKQFSLLIAALLLFIITVTAQQETVKPTSEKQKKHQRNIVKINLTALLLKNYSLQYERVLTKRLSLAIGYRTSPMSSLPFKNKLVDLIGDGDAETINLINNVQFGNTAITPELRWYVGKKGYGRGFYFAPFYRYATYNLNGVELTYDRDGGGQNTVKLNGKITGNTYGLALGSQFFLGKHVTLDMCFLGPHFGTGKGSLVGTSSVPLSQAEQNDIRKELEDIDFPVVKKTVNVTANSAAISLDGPFAGVRFAISLGIKF